MFKEAFRLLNQWKQDGESPYEGYISHNQVHGEYADSRKDWANADHDEDLDDDDFAGIGDDYTVECLIFSLFNSISLFFRYCFLLFIVN